MLAHRSHTDIVMGLEVDAYLCAHPLLYGSLCLLVFLGAVSWWSAYTLASCIIQR
jgi:hypothetical protein